MTDKRPDFLQNSVIVAAHPDDELLWFASILAQVDQVILVYCDFWAQPDLGEARRRALAQYPRDAVTCLEIPESGAAGCADWARPELSGIGLAFGMEATRREATRLVRLPLARLAMPVKLAATSVMRAYSENFDAIVAALRPRLSAGMNVFTHNPWGEYGHEEHVQLFRALDLLRGEMGFSLWMSNYCTERALPLAMRYFQAAPGPYVRLPTDKAFAEKVADVYKRHGCWTWAENWAWFEEECFMPAPHEAGETSTSHHLFPLNFFTIDGAGQRSWLPIALTMSAASAAISVTLSEAI
jgi:LmbE family N-acetylglucosaminyl deacetylase